MCTAPRIISLSPLSLATDVTDATLGASGLWLGTLTGDGGTATLTKRFFYVAAHDNRGLGQKLATELPNPVKYTLHQSTGDEIQDGNITITMTTLVKYSRCCISLNRLLLLCENLTSSSTGQAEINSTQQLNSREWNYRDINKFDKK